MIEPFIRRATQADAVSVRDLTRSAKGGYLTHMSKRLNSAGHPKGIRSRA